MQCPKDRASHTRPLMTPLEHRATESDSRGSKPSDCFCYSSSFSGPSTNRESNLKPLGQCWVPPIVAFYNQQGLLRTYSSPGSSIRSPHPGPHGVNTGSSGHCSRHLTYIYIPELVVGLPLSTFIGEHLHQRRKLIGNYLRVVPWQCLDQC